MSFENSLSTRPSTAAQVRAHLPIVLIGGGVAALFVGLHVVTNAVLGLAALHVVLGVGLLAVRRVRRAGANK